MNARDRHPFLAALEEILHGEDEGAVTAALDELDALRRPLVLRIHVVALPFSVESVRGSAPGHRCNTALCCHVCRRHVVPHQGCVLR